MTDVRHEHSNDASAEVLATQELTDTCSSLFTSAYGLIHWRIMDDDTVIERLDLALPSEGTDFYTKKPTRKLIPAAVERKLSQHGIEYSLFGLEGSRGLASPDYSEFVCDARADSHATVVLHGAAAQIEGRKHPMDAERIKKAGNQLKIALPYDPERKIIVRGLRHDRLMSKGVLGRLGRAGIGVRKLLGGNLEAPTY